MPIVALGMDIIQIDRLGETLDRRGQRFLERIFTPGERAYCERRKRRVTHYAGRFAVKEAVMKALGTGWAQGVRWRDIEVVREPARSSTIPGNWSSSRGSSMLTMICRMHGVATNVRSTRSSMGVP